MKSEPVLLLLKSQVLEIFYPNFTQTFYQLKFDKLKLKKLNLKSPTIAGIAVPGMPHGSPGMELHNHGLHSHDNYKSYEVYSFGENIQEEIFDKVIP